MSQSTAAASAPGRAKRLPWLDGVRAAAALFVLLHHVWLTAFPGFPVNTGPWWLGWALYGHLAVAVFIVISGFSLSLSPLRHGGRLPGGMVEFLRRRAWRILPPYWAALALSMLAVVLVLGPRTGATVDTSSLLVYGLLIQDVVQAPTPNGVFWSIAVEWQIYFLFPLLLLVGRRRSLLTAALLALGVVLAVHLGGLAVHTLSRVEHLTPQFLALFGAGIVAAQAAGRPLGEQCRRLLTVLTWATSAVLVLLAVLAGSRAMVEHYFWVDLGVGGVVACALALLASGRASRTRAVLGSRPAVGVGRFSYSIYLVHAPLLQLAWLLVSRTPRSPLGTYLLLLASTPAVLLGCYAFFLVCERPFLQNQSWRRLHRAAAMRVLRQPPARGAVPAALGVQGLSAGVEPGVRS